MDDFFGAPLWGFIWGLLGTIATIVTLFAILRNALSPQRGLGKTTLRFARVDNFAHYLSAEDKQAKRMPFLHIVEIQNYGREIIEPSDYIRALRIDYGNQARIIGFQIIQDKRFIEPKIYEGKNAHTMQMVELLNSGDSFILGMLVATPSSERWPQVTGRIRGIGEIEAYKPGFVWGARIMKWVIRYFYVPFTLVTIMVTVYLVNLGLQQNNPQMIEAIRTFNTFIGGSIAFVAAILAWVAVVLGFVQAISIRFHGWRIAATFRKDATKPLNNLLSVPHEQEDGRLVGESTTPLETASDAQGKDMPNDTHTHTALTKKK